MLVFNAASSCPTLRPLLDQHTRRHFHFMLDTYPQLMPSVGEDRVKEEKKRKTNTKRFLRDTLERVRNSEHLSMTNRQVSARFPEKNKRNN